MHYEFCFNVLWVLLLCFLYAIFAFCPWFQINNFMFIFPFVGLEAGGCLVLVLVLGIFRFGIALFLLKSILSSALKSSIFIPHETSLHRKPLTFVLALHQSNALKNEFLKPFKVCSVLNFQTTLTNVNAIAKAGLSWNISASSNQIIKKKFDYQIWRCWDIY